MLGFTSRGQRVAFTLIEMLAFIVIISSILLPALLTSAGAAREAARRMQVGTFNKDIIEIGSDMVDSIDEIERLTPVTLPAVQRFATVGDNSEEIEELKDGYENVSVKLDEEISQMQALQLGHLSTEDRQILLPALRTARQLKNGSNRMAQALRLVLFIPGKGNVVSLQIEQRQLQLAHATSQLADVVKPLRGG